MIIDTKSSTIELSDLEINVFLGKALATASMLQSDGQPSYKTFQDKVEYSAEEIYFTTERTVLIHADTGRMIATYNECGLVLNRRVHY